MKSMCRFLPLLLSMVAGGRLRTRHGFLHSHRGQSLSKAQQNSTATLIEQLHPYYHSTEGLQGELNDLATRCPGMSLRTVEGSGDGGRTISIDVVSIRSPDSTPVNKNFLLFGEHSRELISPESGLHFIRTLCGEVPSLADHAKEILKSNEYQIIVNGNPGSRQKVEQGDFCLRVNPDGVDLNRNWDEHWQASPVLDVAEQTSPGPKAFSEPETQVFKQLVEEYRPTTFLTIHSGTLGMYMPWAFDMEHLATRNEPHMMNILKTLDKDHCQCPFGAAGREVGYSCPGTCLDWVYEKLQTQYAFAFEIYTSADETAELQQRWQEKMDSQGSFLQANSHLGHQHFQDVFANFSSSFVQLRAEHNSKRKSHVKRAGQPVDEGCFPHFNPSTEEEYKRVVENWSGAYLDMSGMVVAKINEKAKAGLLEDFHTLSD